MRGILGIAGYLPHHRLDRAAITEATGVQAGRGTRAVASYDEDSTTMAVEAGRLLLRALGSDGTSIPTTLWCSTTSPPYADKTNATVVHAALRLGRDMPALDVNGSVRSASGALRAALLSTETVLLTSADTRTGLPTSADERSGGDAAAAVLVGDERPGVPVLAEHLGGGSMTEEFLDRWRAPGEVRSKQWEERFGENRYVELGGQAWKQALESAGLAPADVAHVVVAGTHQRATAQVAKQIGAGAAQPTGAATATHRAPSATTDLAGTVGNPGAAQPALLLAQALEHAGPGEVIALVVLADGADVLLFRTTEAISQHVPASPVDDQVAAGRTGLRYLTFLSWKGMVTIEPPRRPEPARASASAAGRSADWKFGFVGSVDRSSGAVHLPPARVSFQGGAADDMEPRPMAEVGGTIATFTVDRLAYSPSPPVVFAVIDFDGGGRLPMELTDVSADEVAIGDRVTMTFRRMNQADGIQNYFWKARPVGGRT